jgi:alkanesulfonate monooxygenase SsuD/methylene tetrahydromethanopterin reductase-like flavin-dependent oxidoreductase (luciferase family)
LGVGSGIDLAEFEAFRVEMSTRHERTTTALKILKHAFQGEPLGERGQQLHPPAPTLSQRMWLSGLSEVGAQYAAQHEVGLLLSRAAWANEEPTDVVQVPVAKAYLAEWRNQEVKPRLGLSRGVYVAADKATALVELRQDLLREMEVMIKQGRMRPGQSLEYYCKRLHLAYGHPEEVAAFLSADQALPYSDDLILQFDPMFPSLERAIQMLEQIATQVAPVLGWQPG